MSGKKPELFTPYRCEECGAGYKVFGRLVKHLGAKHGVDHEGNLLTAEQRESCKIRRKKSGESTAVNSGRKNSRKVIHPPSQPVVTVVESSDEDDQATSSTDANVKPRVHFVPVTPTVAAAAIAAASASKVINLDDFLTVSEADRSEEEVCVHRPASSSHQMTGCDAHMFTCYCYYYAVSLPLL